MKTGSEIKAGALPSEQSVPLAAALAGLSDDSGRSLRAISDAKPALVVLLRHTGCTFCRQTISDLARCSSSIDERGLAIVVVGMSASTQPLRELGARFGLEGATWIADPDRLAYRALGLRRGAFRQLLGVRVLWAGLRAALGGHGLGRVQGDPFQMPGTVVIHRGAVLRRFIHATAADRPDYEALACSVQS